MKIHEAFSVLSDLEPGSYKWARPVGWWGCRSAFCLEKDGRIQSVPGLSGGSIAMMPDLKTLNGEWEVVDPFDVNAGR